VGVNFFRGRIVGYETSSTCIIDTQAMEIVATLQERTQSMQVADVPAVGSEAYVIVDPRSITLYHTPPESSARNVFYGEVLYVLRPDVLPGSNDGHVRVSIKLEHDMPPLTAEITEASAARMELSEGRMVYAAFKATEASAYT
jgi:molybdate transport system ATP-binding protein